MDEAPFDKARRLKQARTMKRMAKKIARAKQRAAKKMASPEKLKTRALKQAREKLFMKMSKGKSKNELGIQQRMAVDKKLEKKSAAIKKLAKKMLPQVKAAEKERLKKFKQK